MATGSSPWQGLRGKELTCVSSAGLAGGDPLIILMSQTLITLEPGWRPIHPSLWATCEVAMACSPTNATEVMKSSKPVDGPRSTPMTAAAPPPGVPSVVETPPSPEGIMRRPSQIVREKQSRSGSTRAASRLPPAPTSLKSKRGPQSKFTLRPRYGLYRPSSQP